MPGHIDKPHDTSPWPPIRPRGIGKAEIDGFDAHQFTQRAACTVCADHIARFRCEVAFRLLGFRECQLDMLVMLLECHQLATVMDRHVVRFLQAAQHHRFDFGLIEHVHLRPTRCTGAVPVDLQQGFAIGVLKLVILARPHHRIEQWLKLVHQPQPLQLADDFMIDATCAR